MPKAATRVTPRRAVRTAPAAQVTLTPEGLVTAVAAVTNIVDHVDDLIAPGAFATTLNTRTPKVCFHHDWKDPVGRTLHVEELLPGDARLPKRLNSGRPWPAAAGALIATMQFNMATERGREVFEMARFYSQSNEAEWSIGYRVVPGKTAKRRDGARIIYALDLYEISLVLWGAASETMTLEIKSAGQDAGPALDFKDASMAGQPLIQDGALAALMEAKALNEQAETKSAESQAGKGVMVALYPPADVAAKLAHPDGSPAEDMHITLAYLGDSDELGMSHQELADTVGRSVAGETALQGTVGGLGQFPAGEQGVPAYIPVDVPGLSAMRERVVDGLDAAGQPARTDHGFTPHMTLGYDVDAQPAESTPVSFDRLHVVVGPDSIPIPLDGNTTPADAVRAPLEAKSAADVLGAAVEGKSLPVKQKCKFCKQPATKRVLHGEGHAYVPTCDKHKALAVRTVGGQGEVSGVQPIERKAARMEAKYDTSPVGTPGGKQNWVDKVGGLPSFPRAIAHALIRGGHSESSAIRLAIGACKRWAAGGDNVTAPTRAKAAAAVARWEAMKAASHATKTHPTGQESKRMNMTGSLEDQRDAIREAVTDLLGKDVADGEDEPYVCIEATFPDHVIVSQDSGGQDEDSWLFPYSFADDGSVTLGEPERVALSVVASPAVDDGDTEGDAAPPELASARFVQPVASLLAQAAGMVSMPSVQGKGLDELRPVLADLLDSLAFKGMDMNMLLGDEVKALVKPTVPPGADDDPWAGLDDGTTADEPDGTDPSADEPDPTTEPTANITPDSTPDGTTPAPDPTVTDSASTNADQAAAADTGPVDPAATDNGDGTVSIDPADVKKRLDNLHAKKK